MSRRGKKLLCVNGYTFCVRHHNEKCLKTRWACSTHYTKGCYASVVTVNGEIIAIANEHNHANNYNV